MTHTKHNTAMLHRWVSNWHKYFLATSNKVKAGDIIEDKIGRWKIESIDKKTVYTLLPKCRHYELTVSRVL